MLNTNKPSKNCQRLKKFCHRRNLAKSGHTATAPKSTSREVDRMREREKKSFVRPRYRKAIVKSFKLGHPPCRRIVAVII